MVFDTARFIDDHLINPDAVAGLASSLSVDVPAKDTLRKWFERGSIPGEWWPILLALIETDNGSPVSLKEYMSGSRGNEHSIFD